MSTKKIKTNESREIILEEEKEDFQNKSNWLPNQNISSVKEPIISIFIGSIFKYGLGGLFFDLIGHLLMFIACLNLVYFYRKGKEDKINYLITFLLVGLLFLIIQTIMMKIFVNWLKINPFLV